MTICFTLMLPISALAFDQGSCYMYVLLKSLVLEKSVEKGPAVKIFFICL